MALASAPTRHRPNASSPSCKPCCRLQHMITKLRLTPSCRLISCAEEDPLGVRRVLAPPPSALPEPQAAAAAAPVLVAGIVGVAATLLLRSSSSPSPSSSSQLSQQQQDDDQAGQECGDCGGTGLCGRCKGEGFVFKQLSEDTATKARKAAKNMATRYTAGLPTKWTYCNKCSSTRSCPTCRGSGRVYRV